MVLSAHANNTFFTAVDRMNLSNAARASLVAEGIQTAGDLKNHDSASLDDLFSLLSKPTLVNTAPVGQQPKIRCFQSTFYWNGG